MRPYRVVELFPRWTGTPIPCKAVTVGKIRHVKTLGTPENSVGASTPIDLLYSMISATLNTFSIDPRAITAAVETVRTDDSPPYRFLRVRLTTSTTYLRKRHTAFLIKAAIALGAVSLIT